jgi:flagellar biosynthesis protein FlhG
MAAPVAIDARRAQPEDQADGLRRLFSARTARFIPVVANPFVVHEPMLVRQICAALEQLGLYILLVDVRGQPCPGVPVVRAGVSLGERLAVLSDRTASLSLPGLSGMGSAGCRGVLRTVLEAAPLSQAVVVHGPADVLVSLFAAGDAALSVPRPLVLCDTRPESMTHAYAALKQLSLQARWSTHDLLLSAAAGSADLQRVKDRLAQAAALFLGGVRHDAIPLDPAVIAPNTPATASLMAFMESSLEAAAALVPPDPRRPGPAPVTASPLLQSMV